MEEQQDIVIDNTPESQNSTPDSRQETDATVESSQQKAAGVQPVPGGAEQNTPIEPIGSGRPQADATGQQQVPPEQPQAATEYRIPPGYAVDPATGQLVFVGPTMQQPVYPGTVQPGVVYMQPPQPTPEQVAAQQAAAQQRYGQVINTVEQFIEGEATVADVAKTLYANTAQDDQLWKGVIVGAAAAVLLTNEPVKKAMGKTFSGLFPGLAKKQSPSPAQTGEAPTQPVPEKE
ncbi:MAG TPA: hypothetical protein ENK89_01785 [Desulfobulbaceae bacterium]|nr:hypothetical protein [Desulfobulbaceae bacterium]